MGERQRGIFILLVLVLGFATRIPEARAEQNSKLEITPVPLIGGDSDIGFGGGVLLSIARVQRGYEPYVYRWEVAGVTTFRSANGSIELPFQDYYVLLRFPHLMRKQLEFEMRVSYTREPTLKYYGIGNATSIPAALKLSDNYFEYDRVHPTLRVRALHHLSKSFGLELGAAYTHNFLDVAPDSKLSEDARSEDPTLRDLIGSLDEFGVVTFSYGLAFDTRDKQVAPRHGQYATARIDLAPGGAWFMPHRWSRLNVAWRWFVPLDELRTLILGRVGSDLLFGDPPIYELANFDRGSAIGGVNGVRGVPAQRYHGMIKVLGNLELQTRLFSFDFLNKKNTLAVAAFSDAGRVWATYESNPELDGRGLNLKYGVGGGLRLFAGKSFVLRTDAAWSPDARPFAAYLTSGQLFE